MDKQRLIENFKEQINFIRTSCFMFDNGNPSEAKRIGTSLRILFRNTRSSVSLLCQLDAEEIKLVSTISDPPPEPPGTISYTFDSTYTYSISGYEIDLSIPQNPVMLPVADWLNQIVYRKLINKKDTKISRLDVILHTVEKEGGAHVDPAITPELEMLISDGSFMVWNMGSGDERRLPVVNRHLALLRRFGHELLNSPELLNIH